MAASISIEEEAGTIAGRAHPHNGYYAGRLQRSTGRTGSLARTDRRVRPVRNREATVTEPHIA